MASGTVTIGQLRLVEALIQEDPGGGDALEGVGNLHLVRRSALTAVDLSDFASALLPFPSKPLL